VKNGKTQTDILPPFILYDEDNKKTKQYYSIFAKIGDEEDESKELSSF